MRPTPFNKYPVGECWRDNRSKGIHVVYDGSWFQDAKGSDDTCYFIYYSPTSQMWVVERGLSDSEIGAEKNRKIASFADEKEAIGYAVQKAGANARNIEARVKNRLLDYEAQVWENESKAVGI